MTRELADKLIFYYENCIKHAKNLKELNVFNFLKSKNVHHGICYCSDKTFSENLYTDEWVKSLRTGSDGYWMETPKVYNSKADNIDILKARVKFLKTFK